MSKFGNTVGRIAAAVTKLGGEDGLDLLLGNRLILVDPAKVKGRKTEPLFTFSGRFRSLGEREFVLKERFVIDTSENLRVRISCIGENFRTRFLPKVENNVIPSDLVLSKLARTQGNLPMSEEEPGTINGLGGLSKAEIFSCEFYETLAHRQAIGDFTPVVGYARDVKGILWSISGWGFHGRTWYVEADLVGMSVKWADGHEFVSR